MRAIKFRAWDKKGKFMVEPGNTFNIVIYSGDIDCGFHFENEEGTMVEGDYELMQFTGLKDKNGKEIYEGDLLFNNGHKPGLVRFDEGMFVVGDYLVPLRQYSGETKEVIGNIYENPELLNN